MPKKNELSVNVNNSNILTASNCTTAVIREYFQYVLNLAQSGEDFPVNLDDIFFLAYSRKDHAVRALTSDETFIQGFDYQSFPQNGEREIGGTIKHVYKLSIPCLEFFIARKVRPVFEVYRQVFHQVPEVMDKVLNKVRDDKSKIAKLEKRVESLERQIKIV